MVLSTNFKVQGDAAQERQTGVLPMDRHFGYGCILFDSTYYHYYRYMQYYIFCLFQNRRHQHYTYTLRRVQQCKLWYMYVSHVLSHKLEVRQSHMYTNVSTCKEMCMYYTSYHNKYKHCINSFILLLLNLLLYVFNLKSSLLCLH